MIKRRMLVLAMIPAVGFGSVVLFNASQASTTSCVPQPTASVCGENCSYDETMCMQNCIATAGSNIPSCETGCTTVSSACRKACPSCSYPLSCAQRQNYGICSNNCTSSQLDCKTRCDQTYNVVQNPYLGHANFVCKVFTCSHEYRLCQYQCQSSYGQCDGASSSAASSARNSRGSSVRTCPEGQSVCKSGQPFSCVCGSDVTKVTCPSSQCVACPSCRSSSARSSSTGGGTTGGGVTGGTVGGTGGCAPMRCPASWPADQCANACSATPGKDGCKCLMRHQSCGQCDVRPSLYWGACSCPDTASSAASSCISRRAECIGPVKTCTSTASRAICCPNGTWMCVPSGVPSPTNERFCSVQMCKVLQ